MQSNITCADLLKHINDRMKKQGNERLRRYGVTFMQMQMLLEIRHAKDNTIPLKTLELHFEVAQSTAAGIIVRLEKKDLVSSVVPAEDKRLKYVQLTETGKALCDAVETDMQKGDQFLLAGLNGEEKEQLRQLLLKVKDTMI